MTNVDKAGKAKSAGARSPFTVVVGEFGRWLIGTALGRSRTGGADLRTEPPNREERIRLLLKRGRIAVAAGELRQGLDLFDEALKHAPDLSEAVEARASTLDLMGDVEQAGREFERYRRLNAGRRVGASDRHYIMRHPTGTDIAEYEVILRRVRGRVFPLLAQGNLLLSRGHAAEALDHYDQALRLKKPGNDVVLLRGCALSALGRHEDAVTCFDEVLASEPDNRDALNSRGISRMALGLVDQANADWRRQFDLLAPSRADARACLAMRLADYELALSELTRATAAQPGETYWRLYRLAALRQLGRDDDGPSDGLSGAFGEDWPAPLLSLHAGRSDEAAILALADNPRRRAEAAFQLGVLAGGSDRSAAERWWRDIVDRAPVDTIEYAAARNELARTV